MIRRPRSLALFALAVTGLVTTGCTTFSDNDAAARIGDAELSHDDVEAVLDDFPEQVGPDGELAPFAREIVSVWIRTKLLEGLVDDAGLEITDEDRSARRSEQEANNPSFEQYSDVTQQLIVDNAAAAEVWQRQFVPSEAELRTAYEAGPDAGVACTRHVLVETSEEADDVVRRLDSGETFGDIAAEVSIDPGSAAQGGALGCFATEQFQTGFVPEYVEATFAAEIGTPTDPIESQFGFHVIEVLPFDEVDPAEIEQILIAADVEAQQEQQAMLVDAAAGLDAHVDPRIGTFTGDVAAFVVPIG